MLPQRRIKMIKDRLLALPAEIEDMKIKVLNCKSDLEDASSLMKMWEISKMEIINNELDENGKPLYSNDTKRKIALENMKADDDYYVGLSEKQLSETYHLARLEIQLDRLYNEQSNLRAICRLEGSANE